MSWLTQSLMVTRLSIAGLRPRLWSSLVIVIGMACVTGVLVSMLSVTAGMLRVLRNSGDPDRAIVLASRAVNESGADLTPALVGTILNAPGIARSADGHAIGDARLTDPGQFEAFKEWLTTNPALKVTAERQSDYYTRLGAQSHFYDTMAYFVAAVMSFGALFGAVNILYSSVRARTREIATLRAMGYQPLPLAFSVVFESLFLSVLGAVVGILLAWALVDGHESGSSMVFKWSISPTLMALGTWWAVMLALFGSLFPAIRAARVPVAAALRAG